MSEQRKARREAAFGDANKYMREVVRDIMASTHTTIEITTKTDGSLSGTIIGKRDDVNKAKKLVLSRLQNQDEIQVGFRLSVQFR